VCVLQCFREGSSDLRVFACVLLCFLCFRAFANDLRVLACALLCVICVCWPVF